MKWVLLFSALAFAAGCSRHADPETAPARAAVAVRVATATLAPTPLTQPVAGTVRPAERATIAARVMGTVALAHLAVGQPVQAGEVLVTLQAGELDARVTQARAALNQVERDFEREQILEAKGASTAEAVRTAGDRRMQARAALQEAEAMLTYTRIAAPFAGVVTGDFINPGDLAVPGQPLFELEGPGSLRAEVSVPESLPRQEPGADLTVQWDATTVTGRLAELSPAADAGSRSRLAKIELPAGTTVRSGQFVRVLWPAGSQSILTAPAAAVVAFGQMERVFVVMTGHASLRLVKTGASHGARVEILSGLDAGETVILNPPAALRDGQLVEILP